MKHLLLTIPLLLSTMAIGPCSPAPIGNLDGGADHPGSGGTRVDGGAGTGGGLAGGGAAAGAHTGLGGSSGSGAGGGSSGGGGGPGVPTGGGGLAATGGGGGAVATGGGGAVSPTGAWVSLSPCPKPYGAPPIFHGLAAYDSARRKVHLLWQGLQTEDWEWDPAAGTWTRRTACGTSGVAPALSYPLDDSGPRMAYDSVRSRLVLLTASTFFAGSRTTVPNQLWEWSDGSGWVDKTPPAALGPEPRSNPGLTYDEPSRRTILFGGTSTTDPGGFDRPLRPLQDLWRWDGNAWTNATPAMLPPSWAPASKFLVSTGAGGVHAIAFVRDIPSGSSEFFAQVWRWDQVANTWSRVDSGGAQAPTWSACCRSSFAAPQFDAERGMIVLAATHQERWEWSVATGAWTRINDTSIPVDNGGYAVLAYDSTRRGLFMHAGRHTYERDATGAWVDRTPPATWPSGSGSLSLVYDRTGHQLVFVDSFHHLTTWTWNQEANRWAPRDFGAQIQSSNPLVMFPAGSVLLDDQARGRVLAINFTLSASVAALWQWSGVTKEWVNLAPVTPAREATSVPWPTGSYTAAAIDGRRGQLVLFGGCKDAREPSPNIVPCDHLWELDLTAMTWLDRTPATRPSAWPPDPGESLSFGADAPYPKYHAVYDSRAEAVLMVSVERGELWRWNGSSATWTRLPSVPAETGPIRGAVYDEKRSRVMIFGDKAGAEWNGLAGTWTVLPSLASPGAAYVRFTYDPDKQRVLTMAGPELLSWESPAQQAKP